MSTEGTFRGDLTRAIRANDCQAQPIESGTTGLGIPDLWVRTTKVGAWVELKNEHYDLPLPGIYAVPFRTGQYGWLRRHYELGGISVLGVKAPSGVYFFANEAIREVYYDSLQIVCNIHMKSINGKEFIAWLDGLV
jgi:hypothetical protein